jgi:NDP-sugar pyrophosphorylase family protein
VKAYVLAGGQGTRLKPRFGDLPKPLAPIGGRPFLEHQIEWLAERGIRDIVLCVGYGSQEVRAAVDDGHRLGARIVYSVEDEPLGTAGALARAARHLDGPCWVLNGDTLPEADPWTLERARWESGAVGAVAVFHVDDGRSRGSVDLDARDHVSRFVEKDSGASGAAWVNGGLYAFTSALWRTLPPGPSSLERDVLPALAAAGRLQAVRCEGTFYDIGTPSEWERAERRFAS